MKTFSRFSGVMFGAVLFAFASSSGAFAQGLLDAYIAEGLESNLVLQQKKISLEQAGQSLQIARSYFLPSVSLLSDYTSGKGGRNIAIPIGDLLNPVYTSLNQLTQEDVFPQVENVSQDFFPYNFLDTRVRTSLPLVNTDLHVNRTIHAQKRVLQDYELIAYKRQLVLDIKTAYYSYLSALAAVGIYESAMNLVNKNLSVNEALLRNGKTLPASLHRARSEAETVKAELNDARSKVSNAQMYFNFLLNRPLGRDVSVDESYLQEEIGDQSEISVLQREEVAMLKTVQEINESSLQLHKLSRLPKISAFMDLGIQASDWQFNSGARYFLVGVQLSVPVFQGFRNSMQIRQTKLEITKSEMSTAHTISQFQVMAQMAGNTLHVARQNFLAAQEQLRSAKSYFNLIEKGFQEGINSQIEFIDARNQYTQAELKVNLSQFEMLIASARLERETSSYTLVK